MKNVCKVDFLQKASDVGMREQCRVPLILLHGILLIDHLTLSTQLNICFPLLSKELLKAST